MCKGTRQPSTETGPCTFTIVQFGWVREINKIFIDNQLPQDHSCALSRKLLRDSAQKVRHPNTDKVRRRLRAPDFVAQEVSHDPQRHSQH
jgi:hypothetical protein